MGREFVNIFDEWADSYDASVTGNDPEYKDVFEGYEAILDEVVKRASVRIVEFGTGTGNLTAKLIAAGNDVIGIEPNEKMREMTAKRFPNHEIIDGDLLQFDIENKEVNAFVSSFVFHHLTDEEKGEALKAYASLLPAGGKVVFADTAFITEDANGRNTLYCAHTHRKFGRYYPACKGNACYRRFRCRRGYPRYDEAFKPLCN